jgi:hypothetical protein
MSSQLANRALDAKLNLKKGMAGEVRRGKSHKAALRRLGLI